MLGIYTQSDIYLLDAKLASLGRLPEIIDRAGFGIATLANYILGACYAKSITVLVGKGNNGQDGLAASKYLKAWGAKITVIKYDTEHRIIVPSCDLVIDAILGVGYKGKFTGYDLDPCTKVLAVDIVSGLNSDTGQASKNASRADFTISLAGAKLGTFLGDGIELSGETYLYDLGLGGDLASDNKLVYPCDVKMGIDKTLLSHKWHSGLAVFAGSPNMAGAAKMVATAAMRSGAGIVHLFSGDPSIAALVGATDPEIVTSATIEQGTSQEDWYERLKRFKAAVVGPGLGVNAKEILHGVSKSFLGPIVIDADAISAIAADPSLLASLTRGNRMVVLTPHGGELANLAKTYSFGVTNDDLMKFAKSNSLYLVVKGFPTKLYTPKGELFVLPVNPAQLATAGSGDVLSGILGGSIARWGPNSMALCHGITLHGVASNLLGKRGAVANEIIGQIPRAREMIELWPTKSPLEPFWPLQSRGPLLFGLDSSIDWSARWAQT